MGGTALKPGIKNLIIQTWTDQEKDGEGATATKVKAAVAKSIKGKEGIYGKLPKLRTFQEIIRKAKKKLIEESLDKEWSMASLMGDGKEMSPDAMPYVIKVWRYAINTDELFTEMQAKWVALLCKVYNDVSDLWYYSSWYATIERSGKLTGDSEDTWWSINGIPNTFSPDKRFLTEWENDILLPTEDPEKDRTMVMMPYRAMFKKNGETIEELVHLKKISNIKISNDRMVSYKYLPDSVSKKFRELCDSIESLPTLSSIGFDYDSKMVYLRLYTYMMKGVKIKDLIPDGTIQLIVELRKWVLDEYEKSKEETNKKGIFRFPIQILQKAGYEFEIREE